MKWYGMVGYMQYSHDGDVYKEEIIEKPYYGDTYKTSRRLNANDINFDVSYTRQVSIVADPFAFSNFSNIRYVTYMGVKWVAQNVDVQYPRLVIDLGGKYNEETDRSDGDV